MQEQPRKNATIKILLAATGGLVACGLLLTLIVALESRKSGPALESSQSSDIHPEVRLMPFGVSVKNQDGFAYGPVTLVINMTNSGGGSAATLSRLAAGSTALVPYGDFVEGTKRFSYKETIILTVVVRADVRGKKSYSVLLFPDPSRPGIPSSSTQ